MPERVSKKHSVTLHGHRTSVTLEAAFWDSLKEIAKEKNDSINHIIERIETDHPDNLSSALRIFVLEHYKNKSERA